MLVFKIKAFTKEDTENQETLHPKLSLSLARFRIFSLGLEYLDFRHGKMYNKMYKLYELLWTMHE